MPFLLCQSPSQILVHIYSYANRHTSTQFAFLHLPYCAAARFSFSTMIASLIYTYVLLQHNFRIRYLWKWLLLYCEIGCCRVPYSECCVVSCSLSSLHIFVSFPSICFIVVRLAEQENSPCSAQAPAISVAPMLHIGIWHMKMSTISKDLLEFVLP